LLSVLKQSKLPQEIIIGDDGSSQETALVESFKNRFSILPIHLWQEDHGNRKAKMMNKAIASLISIHYWKLMEMYSSPGFIKDHLSLARSNTYLYGSRVSIQSQNLSPYSLQNRSSFNYFSSGLKRNRTLRTPFYSK
jgi:glycosyltransferase involved in cell wall biosynthesis